MPAAPEPRSPARPTGSREGRQPCRPQASAWLGGLHRFGGPGARRASPRIAALTERSESDPARDRLILSSECDGIAGPGPEGGAPGQTGSRVPERGPGEGEGRRDPRAGLTSRRDGRASVCRNLDTLKRLMATRTAAGAASRTRASALRCTDSSRDSRRLRPHPLAAARGHAQARPRPIPARSGPPGSAPGISPRAGAPPAPPRNQSPRGRQAGPRPNAGGLAARAGRSRAACCPPPTPRGARWAWGHSPGFVVRHFSGGRLSSVRGAAYAGQRRGRSRLAPFRTRGPRSGQRSR